MIRFLGLLLSVFLMAAPPQEETGSNQFVVIVNDKNQTVSLTAEQLSKMFLKKTRTWDNKQVVLPVDLNERSSIRAKFTEVVHHKKVSAVKAYWQQMIFSGRAAPPPEVDTDAEVIKYVQGNPGAIGYVSKAAGFSGVKTIVIDNAN